MTQSAVRQTADVNQNIGNAYRIQEFKNDMKKKQQKLKLLYIYVTTLCYRATPMIMGASHTLIACCHNYVSLHWQTYY